MADPLAANVTFLLEAEGANGSTTFTDTSGAAGNTITVNGDTRILTTQYRVGSSSAYFDGVGDWLEIASNANFATTGDFTVEAWIFPTAYPFNIGGIICNGQTFSSTSTTRGLVLTSTGAIGVQQYGGLSMGSAAGAAPLFTWTHVALSRSGTAMYLFINGVQATTATQTFNLSLGNTLIGRSKYNNDGYGLFQGYIDQVRVTNGVARWVTNFDPGTEYPVPGGGYELFIDGFDYYATADIGKKWPANANFSVSTTGGRRGSGALTASVGILGRGVTPSSRGVIGVAIKFTNTNRGWFRVDDGGTVQLYLVFGSDQRLYLLRGTNTVIASSTNVLAGGVWYYVEMGFHIDNAGSIEVRVNGSSDGWIPYTVIDTQNSANASFNTVYLASSNASGVIDDCYITYGDEIKFLGDSRVDTLALTANASPQDWTPDTGNAWERLNQDAGYISSDTVNATSLFAAGNLSHNPSTIHGVQINGHAYKTDAGSREAAMVLKSGTTTDVGTSLALSTDTLLIREPHIVDPDTGVAFTKAGVDGLEVGVKVTA